MDIQERTAEKMMFDDDGKLVFAGPKKQVKDAPKVKLTFTPGDVVFATKYISRMRAVGVGIKASYQEGNGSLTFVLDGNYERIGKHQDADKGEGTPA